MTRRFSLIVLFALSTLHNSALFAQNDSRSIAFFGGFSSNAPVFGVRNEAYNLRFDSQYPWFSTTLGIEKFLEKTKRSTFNIQLNYQPLPHGSMSTIYSESTVGGVYTKEFDSLIMKSDNIRFSLGVKHYFKEAYKGFYLQYNAGLNLIFNQTSSCSCIRVESENDNYFSETGTYSTNKKKVLLPELSLTFGFVFPLNDQFAIDAGFDVGMPFGKFNYLYINNAFPNSSLRTKVMNLNGLFLTSLIEVHAKFLFIK